MRAPQVERSAPYVALVAGRMGLSEAMARRAVTAVARVERAHRAYWTRVELIAAPAWKAIGGEERSGEFVTALEEAGCLVEVAGGRWECSPAFDEDCMRLQAEYAAYLEEEADRIAERRARRAMSDTVGQCRTRSDDVEHGRTVSDIVGENEQPSDMPAAGSSGGITAPAGTRGNTPPPPPISPAPLAHQDRDRVRIAFRRSKIPFSAVVLEAVEDFVERTGLPVEDLEGVLAEAGRAGGRSWDFVETMLHNRGWGSPSVALVGGDGRAPPGGAAVVEFEEYSRRRQ